MKFQNPNYKLQITPKFSAGPAPLEIRPPIRGGTAAAAWGGLFLTGFSLIEMIVAIGLFAVIVIISIGILIDVSKAQMKAANVQATQDNIRFSLELLTKEMRTGSNYVLTTKCVPAEDFGSEISFKVAIGDDRVYYLDTISRDADNKPLMRIMRVKGVDCTVGDINPLTAEDVLVESLQFKLFGEAEGINDGQPVAVIALKVKSKNTKIQLESSMNLQTTVTQRLRE